MAGRILVGTASWADPGFIQDWYPKGMKRGDLLSYYARHFGMVEVNSTFYAIPEPETTAHWVNQTPADFVFDIKSHRALSRHRAEIAEVPPDLRHLAGSGDKVDLTPRLEAALLDRVRASIAPLVEAHKLGAVLLQMSPSFRPKYNKIDEISAIVDALGPYRLAVELRNRDWTTTEVAPGVVDYFERHGVTLVTVDAPKSSHFMVMPFSDVVTNSGLAYMRLHGRNEKGYISGRTVSERFNYEYSPEEIKETVDVAHGLAEEASEVHIIYNNNHSNLAVLAAEQFMEQAGITRNEVPAKAA